MPPQIMSLTLCKVSLTRCLWHCLVKYIILYVGRVDNLSCDAFKGDELLQDRETVSKIAQVVGKELAIGPGNTRAWKGCEAFEPL